MTRSHTVQVVAACAAVLLAAAVSPAQTFSPMPVQLPGVYASSVAWADYDNDGRLDFMVTGTRDTVDTPVPDMTRNVATIFHNNGDGTFTDINARLMPVYIGTIAWGDYDNDGRMDVIYGGVDTLNTSVTLLYRNAGGGTFRRDSINAFHSSSYGCLAWGDYNNDGALDLLLSGFDPVLQVTKLYRNDGKGRFTEVTQAVLQGVNGLSKVAWGDYDNDGYQDIILCGRTNHSNWYDPQSVTKLYHNNRGTGTFTEDTLVHFAGVARGIALLADLNNDSFLDVFICGLSGPAAGVPALADTSIVYLNDQGSGRFTPVTKSLGVPNMQQSVAAVDDYDADGRLDLLAVGYESGTGLFRGLGDGSFSARPIGGSPTLADGGIAWGDFDNDGYADLLRCGSIPGLNRDTTVLYRNNPLYDTVAVRYQPNQRPLPPTLRKARVVDSTTVRLSWSYGSDARTPRQSLSYALRVGTAPGRCDIVSPLADTSGRRLVPALGAQNLDTAWTLRGLRNGLYYWTVQAIDNARAGSAFAREDTFRVGSTSSSVAPAAPLEYALFQNFPNPFNPSTTIRYSIPVRCRVTLTVFNVLGERVSRLADGMQEAGRYDVTFNASRLASGVYFYRLETRPEGRGGSQGPGGHFTQVRKLMLLK